MTNKYIFNYKIIYTLTFVLLGVFVLSGCSGEFFISLKYHFIKTINQDEKKSLIKCGIYNNKTACKEVDKIFNEKISNSYIERITTDYLNRFNGYLGPLEDISISELTNLYSLDLNDDPNYSANNPLRNLKDVKKDFRESIYYFFENNNTENQGLIFRIEKNICNQLNNANVCKIVALKQLVNLDGSDEIEIEQSGKLTVLERINQYIAYNKKACNLGNFYSCNEIARQYRKGIFVNKNYYTAFNLLKRGFEDQMIFLKKERDELRDRLPAYCLENSRFNTYDTSNIMYVDEWYSNNFSSILSLSLDKNTPNNLKKEISSMLNKYKNFEKCKSYPLPEHSFYYADEFVPKQLGALRKLQQDIYKQREEDRKRDEIYYNEQLKMMNNMPEYLEINGVPCHKSGLGYKCE